jgi:trans-aconitate 2-methyltransferase
MQTIIERMAEWSAGQYLIFGEERTRPCRDLANAIGGEPPKRVIDLGCGPGNSTAVLAARWPDAEIVGLDNSDQMLAAARRDYPSRTWECADIAEWASAAGPVFDLVFSNAALQWTHDHATLFPRLLRRGRILAAQLPTGGDYPAQRLIRSIAASARWRDRFQHQVADWHTHDASFYYDVLAPLASRVDIWETDYLHVMDGPEGIVEWYRGTGLRPFLAALAEPDRDVFLARYLEAIRPCYPRRSDGRILFPFRRLFMIGYRAE